MVSNMRTIDKIITRCDCKYGAPMGRIPVLPIDSYKSDFNPGRIYDCKVPLDNGGYDFGGCYWGLPDNLRVKYNKQLTYIKFYRRDERVLED